MTDDGISSNTRIALALSGGGVRAAVFHLGFLRRLAKENLLENVTQLSTVSGGSLVAAAVIAKAGMRWPTSDEFNLQIYPALRELLTTTDLFSTRAVGWRGLLEFKMQLLHHRAAVLAQLLERWGIKGDLQELPNTPTWWINATCLETGKNWRFSRDEMGDWRFGRHYRPPFKLAEAVAASAAVPYVIGALRLNIPTEGWYDTDPATREPVARRTPSDQRVHLWDGGAYENLGLEVFFKPGRPLIGCDYLICSDASGPLDASRKASFRSLIRGQLANPRLFDIASDQIRSLRSRIFLREIESKTIRGALIRMGNSVRNIDIKHRSYPRRSTYDEFQSDEDAALALLHPTHLKAITPSQFDLLARHGYETTNATLTKHLPTDFPRSYIWSPAL